MTYKTITVCLNDIGAVDQLLEVTRKIAAEHGAHVKGLYVIPAIQVYGDGVGGGVMPLVNDVVKVYFEQQLPKVRKIFEHVMNEDGLNFDFQSVQSILPELATQTIAEAKVSDLVILAARNPDSGANVESDFVERVVLGVGRPVLVVPRNSKYNIKADEALVAWDNSREAARAVFDALPLMQNVKKVHAVTIDGLFDGTVPGSTLAEALDRHDIKTEVAKIPLDGLSAGEALLRAANDLGSGLIVMGCYGHGRLSEYVFGGASRYVLAHLDRPALMAH